MYDSFDAWKERSREEDARLLARERMVRWAAGGFDPDSEDFFSSAVEEFGVPSSCKEVPPARNIGAVQTPLAADAPPQWTSESAGLPEWQLVDVRPDQTEHAFTTSLTYIDSPLSSRVRAHFLQNAPLPSSQSLRTPEIRPRDLSPNHTSPYEVTDAGSLPQILFHDAAMTVSG